MSFSFARRLALVLAILGSSLSLAEQDAPETAGDADVTIEVEIRERKVLGDQVIRLTQGQIVKMIWKSDEETQVHIHGYEIHIPTSPEAPAEIMFEAHATGRYPVTSHGFGGEYGKMHEMLLYIEVYPK